MFMGYSYTLLRISLRSHSQIWDFVWTKGLDGIWQKVAPCHLQNRQRREGRLVTWRSNRERAFDLVLSAINVEKKKCEPKSDFSPCCPSCHLSCELWFLTFFQWDWVIRVSQNVMVKSRNLNKRFIFLSPSSSSLKVVSHALPLNESGGKKNIMQNRKVMM